MKTKIYLVENCFGNLNKVYIGKTKNSRKSFHKKRFGKDILYSYIDEINSLDGKDWKPLECYWIEQFRQWGFDLMNLNSGGGGCSFHTEENKIKMRVPKKNKENYSYPKTLSFIEAVTGKTKIHPESRNINISNSLTGYKQTKEHIFKRSSHLKGKSNIKNKKLKPHNFGDKISKILKGKPHPNTCKPINQYNLKGDLIQTFKSITEACDIVFNDRNKNSNLTKCCQEKIKSAYGFIWKYNLSQFL
jgi:hypothetical protein